MLPLCGNRIFRYHQVALQLKSINTITQRMMSKIPDPPPNSAEESFYVAKDRVYFFAQGIAAVKLSKGFDVSY